MKPKESTTSVTIRVPNEVLAIVDKIAADEDRSRAYVIAVSVCSEACEGCQAYSQRNHQYQRRRA